MKKLIIIMVMTIFTFLPLFSTFSQTKVKDSETVYILSDPYGNFEEKILVDWIRVKGKGKFEVKDPVKDLDDIRKMYGDGTVEVKDGFVLVKGESKDINDVYYRGNYLGKIPFSINIKYFVNGKETPVEKIKGQSGTLRIEISAKTDLKINNETVPLLAMATTSLDAEKVKDVKMSGDIKPMIMGRKYQLSLTLILDPEDSGFIEFESENISLPEIIITVIPSYFSVDIPEPEFFDELGDGIDKLISLLEAQKLIIDQTISNLEKGVEELDFSQFNEALEGINMISKGIKSEADILLTLSVKINEEDLMKLKDLSKRIDSVILGLNKEKEGIEKLALLMDGYIEITKGILNLNKTSQQLAENTQSPVTQNLLETLKKQEILINTLLNGGISDKGEKIPSFKETKGILKDLGSGIDEIASSLNMLKAGLNGVNELIDNSLQMKRTLYTLALGGEINGMPIPGLTGFSSSLKEIESGLSSGIETLSKELTKSFTGIEEILKAVSNSGEINGRYIPGLSVTVSITKEMKKGLNKGIEELEEKKKQIERKRELTQKVDTFIGKPEGAEGRVEFIVKITYP